MGVLTRQQWKGVIDFSKTVDARIVTSFANSVGTRDAAGVWTTAQAKRFLDYTKSVGGSIAAAEFMNEPNLAAMGGAPAGYDAAAYGRDFKIFRAFAKQTAPEMLILGPGSVGETTGSWGLAYGSAPVLKTRDLLVATGPGIDAFSYHHYGAVSNAVPRWLIRPRRTRHCQSSGFGARMRPSRSTENSGMSSNRANLSGTQRRPTRRAVAIRGAARSWTCSATWISLVVWRNRMYEC
jgi:hypothetical protein